MQKLILILLIIKCIDGDPTDPLVVTTPKGVIKGLQGDGNYTMFLGIPYAVVDENNPFGAAIPHPGFNETFEAYQDNATCPQMNGNIYQGTLQCLQLNVYIPKTASSDNKLPIMVYLHGGAFLQGTKIKSVYSPNFLIKHDVIIVSINYRVGPYGFLCLSEPGFSNQGLKDQVLALKWIKQNIEPFGGDVNKITAFGQSAGAMSLDIQLLANEGLVQRAIIQSGFALTPWVISTTNDSIPTNIAKKLGYTGDHVKGALEYLSLKEPQEVVESGIEYVLNSNGHPFTTPCVETVGDDAILTDFPVNLEPKVKGMDIMIGHTNKDAMFLYPNKSNTTYYRNYKFGVELAYGFDGIYDDDIVRHFYIGDKELNEELQSDILDYGTDFVFCHPAERTIEKYINAGAKSVHRYLFTYEGQRNWGKVRGNHTAAGACHGDDLGYLFDMELFKNQVPNEEDQRMINVMTTLWTNFAKYGDPTHCETDLISVDWEPAESLRRPYLNLGKTIELGSRVFYNRMAFWDLYYKLHMDEVKGYKGENTDILIKVFSVLRKIDFSK